MATTRVFLTLNGGWMATSGDPATPDAHCIAVPADRPKGSCAIPLYAICPECETPIGLRETEPTPEGSSRYTGSEYQEHFWHEHTRPALRYEETAS
jgi:hypothetical protein